MANNSKVTHGLVALAILFSAALSPLAAQEQTAKPDNSAVNKTQDETAQNQSSSHDDRLTTASVRKAIVADKQLSSYAHNIKIITTNGTVTLKGPVHSDAEKQQITSDARQVVAPDKIVDQLTVKQ
jgi:hyperosmotically inducible protein